MIPSDKKKLSVSGQPDAAALVTVDGSDLDFFTNKKQKPAIINKEEFNKYIEYLRVGKYKNVFTHSDINVKAPA